MGSGVGMAAVTRARTHTPAGFGEVLRRYRGAAGLSQEELAQRAGLSAHGISDLERGARSRPYPATVHHLAEALALTTAQRAELQAAAGRAGAPGPVQRGVEPAGGQVPTALIGRELELAAIHQRLLAAEVRMLTLTGPGGIGKTRLALQAARGLTDAFEHGVFFVDLTPLRDPALVISNVAQELGVRDSGPSSLLESVQHFLRERRVLLVLDNFEHVADAAAQVGDLLAACPGLRVLATSREPLRLSWEHVLLVPPLASPDSRHPISPNLLADVPSVALFIQRAQAARLDFRMTQENARAIAEICVYLDGLPLGIELAAARTRLLSPQMMAARLRTQPELLASGARDRPERHRTLRAAITWSFQLLTSAERSLFRRLAVFAGGFTLEAAETVCAEDEHESPEVLPLLAALVDRSLVVAADNGAERRYRLLEVIRQYAEEILGESGEAEVVRARLAAWCLDFAERADEAWRGPEQAVWKVRVALEQDNLRGALAWSAGPSGNVEIGLRVAGALRSLWDGHGLWGEGRAWLAKFLAHGTPRELSAARARALRLAGWLAFLNSELAEARGLLEESIALARALEDHLECAQSLVDLAMVDVNSGADAARVATLCGEGLALARELRSPWLTHEALYILGQLAWREQELDTAMGRFEECLRIARELGNAYVLGWTLSRLGHVALGQGDYRRAAELERESLALAVEVGDTRIVTSCLELFARLAAVLGQSLRAARLFGAVDEVLGGVPLAPVYRAEHDRLVAASRNALDADAFSAAWAEGRAMSQEQAVSLALAPAAAEGKAGSASASRARTAMLRADPLTRREREVVALVARGRTNLQIAEDLVISERTVEAHVSNSLGKLSLASRAQLAVWASERGLRVAGTT
jgi:predicted ATPase/DNA-binding CsgD family transcriptional regulator/DNA-binding XRE family transcriptional regulator